MRKTISKTKATKTTPIVLDDYDIDLVAFMKKMYAKIIYDICYVRKHDEDNGCDIDCCGMQVTEEYEYKGEKISVVYFPAEGEYWCTKGIFYVNCTPSMKFSEQTLKKIKSEFQKIRHLLVDNFNEIRELSGGKWYDEPKTPINPRHILGLVYDLYYEKAKNRWKLAFTPSESIGASDGGRWIPYDVMLITDKRCSETREELFKLYGESYRDYGCKVEPAVYD